MADRLKRQTLKEDKGTGKRQNKKEIKEALKEEKSNVEGKEKVMKSAKPHSLEDKKVEDSQSKTEGFIEVKRKRDGYKRKMETRKSEKDDLDKTLTAHKEGSLELSNAYKSLAQDSSRSVTEEEEESEESDREKEESDDSESSWASSTISPDDTRAVQANMELETLLTKNSKSIGNNNIIRIKEIFRKCYAVIWDYEHKLKTAKGKLKERAEILTIFQKGIMMKKDKERNCLNDAGIKEIEARHVNEIRQKDIRIKDLEVRLKERIEFEKLLKEKKSITQLEEVIRQKESKIEKLEDSLKERINCLNQSKNEEMLKSYQEEVKKKDEKIKDLEHCLEGKQKSINGLKEEGIALRVKVSERTEIFDLLNERKGLEIDKDELKKQEVKIKELETRLEEKQESLNMLKHSTSYAEVMKQGVPQVKETEERRRPGAIIVFSKKEEITQEELKKEIKKYINPYALGIGVTGIKNIRNNGLVVECEKLEDAEILHDEILCNVKLKDLVKVERTQKKLPKVIIYDVAPEYTEKEVHTMILQQNNYTVGESTVLNWKLKLKGKAGRVHHVFETDPHLFHEITNSKVHLEWTIHKAVEFIHVPRCYTCYQYGHFYRDCKEKEQLCSFCTGEHSYRD